MPFSGDFDSVIFFPACPSVGTGSPNGGFLMDDDRILVNKREAARLLSISVTSLDYLIRQRELVIRRLGRRTLVSVESLRDYARADHDRVRGEMAPR